jgi:hypothetical protein
VSVSVYEWADGGPRSSVGTDQIRLAATADISDQLIVFSNATASAHYVAVIRRNLHGENALSSPADTQPGTCVENGTDRQCSLLVGRIVITTSANQYDVDDPALALGVQIAAWLKSRLPAENALTTNPVILRGLAPPPAAVGHACTRTDEGTCIRGGEFCRDSDEGTYGYDANGTRYYCTDGHWEDS